MGKWHIAPGGVPHKFLSPKQLEEISSEYPDIDITQHEWKRDGDDFKSEIIEVQISKETVCKLATCSLQGLCIKEIEKQIGKYDNKQPIKLVFFGSSLEYCRKNGGPELLIMPDFTPFCIAESILEMIQGGWQISLELREI